MASLIKKTAVAVLIGGGLALFFGPRLLRGEYRRQGTGSISKWRPTQELAGVDYVGSAACGQCHKKQALSQADTPMAHALEIAQSSRVLETHGQLTFHLGPYSYLITRRGSQSSYSVTDGVNSISEPIVYCFGQGVAGQTYVLQHNGVFYESHVSYYTVLQSLDITILHSRAIPSSLEEAFGRPMNAEAARGCFSCHSTASTSKSRLQVDHLTPGVTCEACHGPGSKHIAAVKIEDHRDSQIFNPGKLDTFDLMQEFCGACHESFDAVMLLPQQGGLNNIRFQPYRSFKSPAHFLDDPRMSCTACHDPHGKLEQTAKFYDSKCLACHLSTALEHKTETRMASACPVSKEQCVTCHMPKVELPEMHYKFTDHWIRITKPNQPIPN